MPIVAVFDTNVLLSASGWRGAPYECVELARQGKVNGVTCQAIVDELAEKLVAKLLLSEDDTLATIADLLTFLSVVEIGEPGNYVPMDPR